MCLGSRDPSGLAFGGRPLAAGKRVRFVACATCSDAVPEVTLLQTGRLTTVCIRVERRLAITREDETGTWLKDPHAASSPTPTAGAPMPGRAEARPTCRISP